MSMHNFARHLMLYPNRVINKEKNKQNKQNRVYSNSENAQ